LQLYTSCTGKQSFSSCCCAAHVIVFPTGSCHFLIQHKLLHIRTYLHKKLDVHVVRLRSLPADILGLTHRLGPLVETLVKAKESNAMEIPKSHHCFSHSHNLVPPQQAKASAHKKVCDCACAKSCMFSETGRISSVPAPSICSPRNALFCYLKCRIKLLRHCSRHGSFTIVDEEHES
jgi:hypothetical protein